MSEKIKSLQVTLEPHKIVDSKDSYLNLRVSLRTSGGKFEQEQRLAENHFDSLFERMMDESKYLIKRAVEEN